MIDALANATTQTEYYTALLKILLIPVGATLFSVVFFTIVLLSFYLFPYVGPRKKG